MKIEKKAAKALKKMPSNISKSFLKAFKKIESGETKGLDIKPMQGSYKNYTRLRIGDYRAIYTIDMEVIVITAGPRGKVYKGR